MISTPPITDLPVLLTRGTIWFAIVAYAIGSAVLAFSRKRSRWLYAARAVWTTACLSLIAHFICAFHFYHDWSHVAAYRDTARQTKEVVGLNWGGGLFINYAVLIAWMIDIGWWWLRGINSYHNRKWLWVIVWHALLIFIIFNATVVFKGGVVRCVGLVMSLFLVISWILIIRQNWSQAYVTQRAIKS